MADNPIKVGGAYKESDDHVPNPTDMVAQFNTSGLGAHGRIEEVAPVFEVDKVKTAQEILGAFDPKNDAVKSDRVLLPEALDDNETAKKNLTEAAEARVKQGVVVGGPTPAEREAELEGDEGSEAAAEQERQNAAANSTGNRDAGQHGDSTQTGGSDSTETKQTSGSGDDAKAKDSSDEDKAKTAKKTTSSSSSQRQG